MRAYPLKFRPIFKERIWGGRRLAELFRKPLPDGARIGESWELADLPDDKSVVANGELAGMTLAEAIAEYPLEITGQSQPSGQFPLLLKLLDAQDVLSVQVHPDEETCLRRGKGEPKTECWYVIEAAAGACIYKGLKNGVTRQDFEIAIGDGTTAELLNKIEVKEGECHLLPAGTPHAIGAGLVIAEVQTPSDTTYRVYDWGRTEAGGKPRELHIADGLASIDFKGRELPVTTVGRLVDTEFFKVDKGHQAAGTELLLGGVMKVLMFIQGGGMIVSATGGNFDFKAGETILVPAAFEGAAMFDSETQYLSITL
jgi:mannose-6-phosphate isomerase